MYKKIVLKKGKEESLLRRHPWIFSGAILEKDETLQEGDLVKVYTRDGDFMGVGHFQIGSITVRILSFRDVPIDAHFWQARLKAAMAVREAIGVIRPAENMAAATGETVNTTYRLVHGEGDNLPGLIVDVYGTTCVMQAHSVGMHVARYEIAAALRAVMGEKVDSIYYKSETTLPFKAELGQENGFIYGNTDNDIAIENGLKFHIDWLKGQKTGFFIDQRENRSLLEHYAKGRSVLNMFCYTGGFSVYAMRGGAKLVHSVDSSAKAVELTNANIELNFPGDNRHEAICEDAFGYTRLNVKGFERIKKGGILFTFSCSQVVTKENFRQAVFTAAAQTGRKVRILHQIHQPADHPINIYHLEGEYLKGLVLYVE